MRKSINTRKIVLTAILTALGILSFTIESLFPPLFIPGARLGISNVFIFLVLIFCGKFYAYSALIIKVLLGSLFAGNFSAILYGLPAGLLSLTAEVILYHYSAKFSVVAISTLASVINTTAQNVIFCLITKSTEYFVYLPYLAMIGIISGLFVGFAVYLIVRFFPQTLYDKLAKEN